METDYIDINVTRYSIYNNIKNWEHYDYLSRDTKCVIEISILIIKDIEDTLLNNNYSVENTRGSAIRNIDKIYQERDLVDFLYNRTEIYKEFENLRVKLEKIKLLRYSDKNEIIANLIKFLNYMQNKIILTDEEKLINLFNVNNQNFVFTSYSYDERYYTFGLFLYFLEKGVYLYLDWMHNSKLDPIRLKIELASKIGQTNQFLFIRSPRSELRLSGSGNIRQWCAWEIGQFYKGPVMEKFYLNTYGLDLGNNDLLSDFRGLKGIRNGLLV